MLKEILEKMKFPIEYGDWTLDSWGGDITLDSEDGMFNIGLSGKYFVLTKSDGPGLSHKTIVDEKDMTKFIEEAEWHSGLTISEKMLKDLIKAKK